mmetsp:Transcript_100540/g.314215  ORF Transcript_100540/g.314215 Transcript_100540/m.314215 type:complete len:206 (+) Transcript_100540:1594-2211(+)
MNHWKRQLLISSSSLAPASGASGAGASSPQGQVKMKSSSMLPASWQPRFFKSALSSLLFCSWWLCSIIQTRAQRRLGGMASSSTASRPSTSRLTKSTTLGTAAPSRTSRMCVVVRCCSSQPWRPTFLPTPSMPDRPPSPPSVPASLQSMKVMLSPVRLETTAFTSLQVRIPKFRGRASTQTPAQWRRSRACVFDSRTPSWAPMST